jgi:glycosyltransferase involved in cell wall biosynthesis
VVSGVGQSRRVGVVAIGRNEGERLRRCLESVIPLADSVVYVDSGSSDGSADLARSLGATVVDLDMSRPFTAARARNAGFDRLRALDPSVELVQFVDGDCEVAPGWISAAVSALASEARVAVVCGRRRERHPDATVYNRLCDFEWDTPVGEALACGGDAMMRASALADVGGYEEGLIAGEEPDLCLRLRRRGHVVLRLPVEMTVHDAAMTRFGQWWRRSVRAGHAFAEGAARHGRAPERHWVRETRSLVFWGGALPLAALLLAPWTRGASLAVLLLAYAVQFGRIYLWERRQGRSAADARVLGAFLVLAKFPEFQGAAQFAVLSLAGRRSKVIDYKGS